jgi:alpha-L-rhamnosidase
MFSLGATTIWENMSRYDPVARTTQKSLSHPFQAGFDHWFYEAVAGVGLDRSALAFKKLRFAPKLVGLFTHAEGSFETPFGRAASAWKIEGGRFSWELTVPANTTATVHVPENVSGLQEDGGPPRPVAAPVDARRGQRTLSLGSGRYRFQGEYEPSPKS